MPELPEVETIKRGLIKRIVGKTIADVDVRFPKTFVGSKLKVEGSKIKKIERRAKVLAVKLDNGENLLFHLKMTGQLVYRHESGIMNHESWKEQDQFAGGHPSHDWHLTLPNSTTAIIFKFDDGSRLFFNDMRKFGWCKVLTDEQLNKIFIEEYGLEPVRLAGTRSGQASQGFTVEYLISRASKVPNRKIKQFLTDQTIIAGIGNIYADESLFDARISPLRQVKEIKLSEWKKIVTSVKKVLELAIKHGGTTDSDFVNAYGEKGGMQDYLKVYRKNGTDCPKCDGKIIRITIGGRGTHYCPVCQS